MYPKVKKVTIGLIMTSITLIGLMTIAIFVMAILSYVFSLRMADILTDFSKVDGCSDDILNRAGAKYKNRISSTDEVGLICIFSGSVIVLLILQTIGVLTASRHLNEAKV
jgi:hypothetical protein